MQSLWTLRLYLSLNLLDVVHIVGGVDVLQDESPEGDILCSEGRKSRQGLPTIGENSCYRLAIAFADSAVITMPI
jgi:hypothetical protein